MKKCTCCFEDLDHTDVTPIGVMESPIKDLYLANCNYCKSTLAIPMDGDFNKLDFVNLKGSKELKR